MTWFIRPLIDADQTLLWEFLYHAIFVAPDAPPPPRDIVHQPELARYARDWGRRGDMGFVAEQEGTGQPIGGAWLRLWDGADHGFGYTDAATPELTVAVLPDHRGHGVGTALFDRLLRAADTVHPAVALSVDPASPAVAFCQRLGFVVTRQSVTTLTMVRRAASGTLPSEEL